MKTRFVAEYTKLDTQKEANRLATKSDTTKATNKLAEAVIQTNSREKQGMDFGKYIRDTLSGESKIKFDNWFFLNNSKTDLASTTASNERSLFVDVSIPNLIDHTLNGTVYISDGAYGWSEKSTVKRFTEFYNTNKTTLQPILQKLAPLYKSGQSLENTLDVPVLVDRQSITDYLMNVSNEKTFGTNIIDEQTKEIIKVALRSTKDDAEFLKIINNALKLGGHTGNIGELNALKTALSDPSLKYTIIAGIRTAARMSGGVMSLRDTQEASGISENERKVLEKIDASKDSLIAGLKNGFEKQLAEQIKNGTIPVDKQTEAKNAIDAYIAELAKEGSS